ncbi:Uncharacterized protein AC499_1205 [Pseudomonas amygdali pv. lachrymans]|nr:Uncharacterized protein AC499_0246 [Pseudomonas amygdali pv. lachrymans]KPC18003.1 Uncharacterized protein AC499_1205 [Pseudomonas amygdali pv. lachrymans]
MILNDDDAKSICALMYFGWKVISFEDAGGDGSDKQIKISLSRKDKMITRMTSAIDLVSKA